MENDGRRSENREIIPGQERLPSSVSPLTTLLENPAVLDELSRCLDKKMTVLRNWSHLADKLEIPADVVKRFEGYNEYSPTIRMFDYLQATRPNMTLGELREALNNVYSFDAIRLISDSGFSVFEDTIANTIAKNGKLLDSISIELDSRRCNFGSWRELGNELKIERDILNQFEMYSESPTKMLFKVLKSQQPQLTVCELREHLVEMKREDVLKILDYYSIEDSAKVVDSFKFESDILNEVAKLLNSSVVGIGNWRSLASRLGISSEICDDCEGKSGQRSPTKQVFKWLVGARQSTTVSDVIKALEQIERHDAIKILAGVYSDISETGNHSSIMDEGLAAFALEPSAREPEKTRRSKEKAVKVPVQESSLYSSSKEIPSKGYGGDLPCMVGYFTGRETELDEVVKKLNNNNYKIVAVIAPPGYGKTTFAVEVARRMILEGRFVIYVNSRGVASVDDLAYKLIRALGFEPGINAAKEALSRLRSLTKDTIVIIDNLDDLLNLDGNQKLETQTSSCDQTRDKLYEEKETTKLPFNKTSTTPAEEFRDFIEQIGQNCCKVKILLTSREMVEFVGIPLWIEELNPLSTTHSGELLMKLCTVLSQDEAKQLGQICGCIPLNLCNIASTIQSRRYAATKDCLSKYIKQLSSSPPEQLMKEFPSQRKCQEFTFQRLDLEDQKLMISVSVFAGMFTLKQAEIVTKHAISVVEEKLEKLVKRYLIHFDPNKEQYCIHSFTRHFCIVKGKNDPFKECYKLAKKSFVDHYAFRLEELYTSFLSKESERAISEYRNDNENIKQLVLWCADNDEIDDKTGRNVVDVINMAAPMIAKVTGRAEFERLFSKLVNRWSHDNKHYTDCLVSIGMKIVLACACSPVICPRALADAMTYLEVANQFQEKHGIAEGNGRAQCLSKFGRCNIRHGLVKRGFEMLTDAKDIRSKQQERDKTVINSVLLAACWNDFAAAYSYRKKFLCALNMSLELVLPVYLKYLGDHPYTASVLNSIGNYYEAIGKYEDSIKYTKEALGMRTALLGDHQETARSYYDLGVALEGKEMYEDALVNLERAAAIQEKVLDTHEETMKSHQERAVVLKILGREKEAMDARSLAEDIFRKLPKITVMESKPVSFTTNKPIDFPS